MSNITLNQRTVSIKLFKMVFGIKRIFLLVVSLTCGSFCIFGRAGAQSYSNYSSLVSTVLSGYNSDIIPLDDHSQTLTIKVTGYLYTLLNVDVVLGKITVVFALNAAWEDSQIQWTPSDYGNLSYILIPREKVWTPDFILGTPVDFTRIGESWMPVTFFANGSASVLLGDVVDSGCTFNMKFWPFDSHVCDIQFIVYGYHNPLVVLETTSSGSFDTSQFPNDNIEWIVTDNSSYINLANGWSVVNFRIEIERRSGIFVILIIFPLYGLAFLNSFVFLIPIQSGERIGFSMTIMLSITVFLETISDYIPNTSKPIPLLCIVVAFGISMSILCTFMVIISLCFFHRDEQLFPPAFCVNIVRLLNRKFRNPKVRNSSFTMSNSDFDTQKFKHTDNTTKANPSGDKQKRDLASNDTSPGSIRKNMGSNEVEELGRRDIRKRDETYITWQDVSSTIDSVTFLTSVFIHTVVMAYFTIYMLVGTN